MRQTCARWPADTGRPEKGLRNARYKKKVALTLDSVGCGETCTNGLKRRLGVFFMTKIEKFIAYLYLIKVHVLILL